MLESHGASRQIQPIGAQRPFARIPFFSHQHGPRLIQPRLERIAPCPQGPGIVWPQAFDIDGLETTVTHGLDHPTGMGQFAAGKDIALDEFTHAIAKLGVIDPCRRDAMIEQHALGPQQLAQLGKISLQLGTPHMLEHADRGDLVERLILSQVAVIEQQHPHPVGQTTTFNQTTHIGMLIVRQRNPGSLHTIVFGSPQQQPAPASPNIQETFSRLQPQLAADMVELGFLGLSQRHLRFAVIGTRIHPARIQPEGIEGIGQVIVEFDLSRIAVHRVPPHRHQPAYQFRQPTTTGGLNRGTRQQCSSHGHDVTHAPVNIKPAFDVILPQHPDLAGSQTGERFEIMQPQTDDGHIRTDLGAIWQNKLNGMGKLLQPVGYGVGYRTHDTSFGMEKRSTHALRCYTGPLML